MQVLYTKLVIPEQLNGSKLNNAPPAMLPKEVGELVGKQSLANAHNGMSTLFDIGCQVTSAVFCGKLKIVLDRNLKDLNVTFLDSIFSCCHFNQIGEVF